MKNINKAIFIFVLSYAFIGQMSAQDYRDVYWLHGLNGNNNRLFNYAETFGGTAGERQMESIRPSYASTGTIDEITAIVAGEFTPKADNIGIGASLGGIVLRNLEAADGNPDELGGIITMHSPNLGAAIATSVNNGAAEDYFINMQLVIREALEEIDEHLASGFDLWDLVLGNINAIISANPINELLNLTIEIFANNAEIPAEEEIIGQIQTAFDLIQNSASQGIFADLDPTNSFMDDLNNYPSTLPRIEIHGFESDKEPFRMKCSDDKMVWTDPLANTDPIPDGDCQIFEDLADGASKLNQAQIALNAKGVINATNPLSWLRKKRRSTALFEAAGDVKEAKNLVKHGIEHGYEALLGRSIPITVTRLEMTAACQSQLEQLYAQEYTIISQPGGEMNYAVELAGIYAQIEALLNGPGCHEEVQVTIYVNNRNDKYDGLLLDVEQKSGSALATYENDHVGGNGVNHVESLNHPSTWNNLNLIFDDQNSFFYTPPR